MTNQLAVVIASLIIGGSILATSHNNRYQIVPAVAADGNPFVFRLDVETGQMKNCTLIKSLYDQFNPDNKAGVKVFMACLAD